jgi:xylulose-5-phosphate/fructose-6-phosphate phosphoketolase
MGANPHANGGLLLLRDCRLPDFRDYAVDVAATRRVDGEATRVLGQVPARRHEAQRTDANFRSSARTRPPRTGWRRVRGHRPRLGWPRPIPATTTSPPDGRVMEVLSEHLPGLARGLPADRPARPVLCYEAFIHIVDSMFNQHAKWLKVTAQHPVAAADRVAQLPADLARLAPGPQRLLAPGPRLHRPRRQQEGRVVRVYLPPDANTLLSVTADHCLRSRNYVNVIVAGKQPAPQWLTMDQAVKHCTAGIGIWDWASNDDGGEPDVVMACAGDVPTLETLAAVEILREHCPS